MLASCIIKLLVYFVCENNIFYIVFAGHPNMGGPMQRMTPPRGMVPLGPQVFSTDALSLVAGLYLVCILFCVA